METVQKNKAWFIAIAILIFINIATLSILLYISLEGKKIAFNKMPKMGGGAEFLMQSLAFNTEQEQKFSALKQEHQEQTRQIRDQQKIAKEAFFSLLKDSLITLKQIEVANENISQYEGQLNLITFKHFKQVRALCSISQQKKFDSLINNLIQQIAMPRPPRPNNRKGDDPHFFPADQPPPPREEGQEPPPRRDGEDRPPR